MTEAQGLALALFAATAAVLAWGRLPADLVGLSALIAGVMAGVVPADRAFAGFGSGAVIVIAATSLTSAAIVRSGAVETLLRPLLRRARGEWAQLAALVAATATLSAVTRSAVALAALMPFATQSAARRGTAPSALLLPLAYAAMAGGQVTLIGSSTNIVVAGVRGGLGRAPFALFDFAPVGLGVALAVLLAGWAGHRLLPDRRAAAARGEPGVYQRSVTAEARVPADSAYAGRPVAELEEAVGDGAVRVALILRERFRRLAPTPDGLIREDDVLLLSGEPDDLERLIATAGLVLEGTAADTGSKGGVREGVVTAGSALVGATVREADLRARHGVSVLAVGRRDGAVERRLRFLRFRAGDVLVLQGDSEPAAEAMEALRILPLSERPVALGARRRSWAPLLVLAGAMTLATMGIAPPAVAFTGAAVAVLLLRAVTGDEVYRTVEWSAVVMLAALIPLADAVRATGASALAADGLAGLAGGLPPAALLALIVALALVAASYLNAALVALVLAPVAAALAGRLGLGVDAFLMAVATGAACGFLSPRGHRCVALVAAPGGYAPADYRRLGLPLALVAVAVGTALIALVWGAGGR